MIKVWSVPVSTWKMRSRRQAVYSESARGTCLARPTLLAPEIALLQAVVPLLQSHTEFAPEGLLKGVPEDNCVRRVMLLKFTKVLHERVDQGYASRKTLHEGRFTKDTSRRTLREGHFTKDASRKIRGSLMKERTAFLN